MENSEQPLKGRTEEFKKIEELLSNLKNPVPFIHLIGLPGSGKTTIIKNYLKNIKTTWIYADYSKTNFDNDFNDIESLYRTILTQLRDGILRENNLYQNKINKELNSKSFSKLPYKIGNSYNFFEIFQKYLSYSIEEVSEYSILLVLDSIDDLVENHPDFIASILRHKEYLSYQNFNVSQKIKRNLSITFLSRKSIPAELFPGSLSPINIRFNIYTREQLKEILYDKFYSIAIASIITLPSDSCDYKYDLEEQALIIKTHSNSILSFSHQSKGEFKLNYSKLKEFWWNFINDFVNMTYSEYKSDFHECKFLCRQMWIAYLESITQGNLRGKQELIALKLKKDIGPHIRKSLSRRESHFTSDLYDPSFLSPGLYKSLAFTIVAELSFFGRLLIVAASVAASTHKSRDIYLIEQCMKFKLKTRKKNSGAIKNQVLQNPFTFSRWLFISDVLSHLILGSKLELTPFLKEQIISLIHMRFISPWNHIDPNKSSRNMSGFKRPYSSFTNFPFFDPFGQPIFSLNFKNSTYRRQSCRSDPFFAINPQSKMCCRIPLNLIQEAAKTLPGIKLDELI